MGKGAAGAQRSSLVVPAGLSPDEQALEQVRALLNEARIEVANCTNHLADPTASSATRAYAEAQRLWATAKELAAAVARYQRAEARSSVIVGPRKGNRLTLLRLFQEVPAAWADRPLTEMSLRSPRGIRLQFTVLPRLPETHAFDSTLTLREQAARWAGGEIEQIPVLYVHRQDARGVDPSGIIVETTADGDIVPNYAEVGQDVPLHLLVQKMLHTDEDRAAICKDVLRDFHAVECWANGVKVHEYDADQLTLGELARLLTPDPRQPSYWMQFKHGLRYYPGGQPMLTGRDSGMSVLNEHTSVRLRVLLPSSPRPVPPTPA